MAHLLIWVHGPAPFEKIFPLRVRPKSPAYLAPSLPLQGRIAIVTDAGRDAVDVDGALTRAFDPRTAKTCGPDASTLASSLRRKRRRRRWQKSPIAEESAE
jgi:hypothetical protein